MNPRCPYCLDDIHPDDEPVRCAKCRTPHHAGCFQENQVCVAYGCLSTEEVPAGLSLFRKPLITVHHRPTREEALGPFTLGWRALPRVPEQRPPSRCPPHYARMSLEGREVREGEVVRGRAVLYTPMRLEFKRVELVLLQGISRPEAVGRVTLAGPDDLGLKEAILPVGSHPFYLEIRAPLTTGPVDPFLFEVVLVRGLLRAPREVRSLPMHLFLLEQRYAPPARPEPPAAIRLAPREPEGPRARSGRAPRVAAPEDGWRELPVVAPSGIFAPDEPTGQTVAARFVPGAGAGEPLALQVPPTLAGDEFRLRVTGDARLSALTVAIHYELVRPGGGEVAAPGFPATEEARVLGAGALDPARFGGEALELRVRVPRRRFTALARARQEGAHNATLRLRLALDAIEPGGRVVGAPSRTITYTGPVAGV
ncbi:MAG: hypothetical protein M9894_04530 [Planctomycetes bacterium]|nr:hypothetical protein [Planctomycetota bacterium]